MASFMYTSGIADAFKGNVDYDTDTIKVVLLTSAYTPAKTHKKRSDLTNEVTGTGYTAGGATATITVTQDDANSRVDMSLGSASWPSSTITARYAAYYKSRGGAATADELIAINDFGSDITSSGATFSLPASTARIQN